MKKEHLLIIVIGLFLFSYLLDAVVNPLRVPLSNPYQFFSAVNLRTYAFSTVSISLKAISILILPLLILNFFGATAIAKGLILLVLSVLLQLYALQDIATRSLVIPLEWSLGFALAGILLLFPTLIYILTGILKSMHQKVVGDIYQTPEPDKKLHHLASPDDE